MQDLWMIHSPPDGGGRPAPAGRGERRSASARDPGSPATVPQFSAALEGARRKYAVRRSGPAQESEAASQEPQSAPAALVFAAQAAPEAQLNAAPAASAADAAGTAVTAAQVTAVFSRAVAQPQDTAGMGLPDDAPLDGPEGQSLAASFPKTVETRGGDPAPGSGPQVSAPEAAGGQPSAPVVERPAPEKTAYVTSPASPAAEGTVAPASERVFVQPSSQPVPGEAAVNPPGPEVAEAQSLPGEARQSGSQDVEVRQPAGLEQPIIETFSENTPGKGLEVIVPESTQPVDMIDAFGPWVEKLQRSGKSSLELRLHPQELGEIQVLLKSTREGASVVIRVEQAAAGSLLEQNLGDLRRSLADAGVQVTEIQVEQGPAQFDARAGSQERSPDGRLSRRLNVPAGAHTAEPAYSIPQALRSSPGLVEYLI